MALTPRTFQNVQADVPLQDLRARTPINQALQYLADISAEIDTEIAAEIAAAIALLKATANTWTAAQTVSLTTAGNVFAVLSTDAGAAPVGIEGYKNSATPAANDQVFILEGYGEDSAGNKQLYGAVDVSIADTTSTTERGQVRLLPVVAGASVAALGASDGVIVGSPTGTFKGIGTLNLDNGLYKDGTQVVSDRRTGWSATTGTELRTNFGDASLSDTSQALRALIVDLKAHGLIGS
jgi:hypothetical protein